MVQAPEENPRVVRSRPALETDRPVRELWDPARIVVVGVGGGGGKSVQRMAAERLKNVEFLVVDTDGAALAASGVPGRLRIGDRLTRGLGTGGDPGLGARAADAAQEEVRRMLGPADMVLVTAGLAGGTGAGAAPIIAGIAREIGALTVGIVTWPFTYEGSRRQAVAEAGLQAMKESVNTLLVIANDRLSEMAKVRLRVADAFRMADEMVYSAVRGITDLIAGPGLICFDFADANSILAKGGGARMALGRGEGEHKARNAAEAAIACPLLDAPMSYAAGILLNVTGGPDTALEEVKEAIDRIYGAAQPDVNLLCGAVIDHTMEGKMRVTAVVTGLDVAPPVAYRPLWPASQCPFEL